MTDKVIFDGNQIWKAAQCETTQLIEDGMRLRFLVMRADPGELVRLLSGSRDMPEWRTALDKMEEAERG